MLNLSTLTGTEFATLWNALASYREEIRERAEALEDVGLDATPSHAEFANADRLWRRFCEHRRALKAGAAEVYEYPE